MTKELFEEVDKIVKELGFTSGFIRAAALFSTTVEEIKNAYLTFKTI